MSKFNVTVQFTIKADTRGLAWQEAREICRKHLRDLATVIAVTSPLLDPEEWIAVNEPIKGKK